MDFPRLAAGANLGIAFPTTIEALLSAGPDFLTPAFRATGALPRHNAVTAITGWREFFGGGMGRKLVLNVLYDRAEPHLATTLFAKFPRDFGDPLRDLFTPLMEPECRFALLSRRPDFPISVPRCYFADYCPDVPSGLLITECIPYGVAPVEPHYDKCVDYDLADPLPHYRALTRAMAGLAGAHKSGHLGADIDREFPFAPDEQKAGSAIPYTPETLAEKLAVLRRFADEAPNLFEPQLRDPMFLTAFCAEAPLVLQKEAAIRDRLNTRPDEVALCHWNMNLDNAWFWRDGIGNLQTGLLDWGSVGQMNLAQSFYGMSCAAETGFIAEHRGQLIDLFVAEYAARGGPALSASDFADQVKIATALLGIAWILDAPSLVQTELIEYRSLTGRTDPRLRGNFLARAQLQLLMVFLNDWRVGNIGALLAGLPG